MMPDTRCLAIVATLLLAAACTPDQNEPSPNDASATDTRPDATDTTTDTGADAEPERDTRGGGDTAPATDVTADADARADGADGGAAGLRRGPSCPEPPQVTPGDEWPEVYVGTDEHGCDDSGDGTRDTPFCTFEAAFAAVPETPGIVTIRSGTYRVPDLDGGSIVLQREGSADAYFLIRAAQGADPVILGSQSIAGSNWTDTGDGLWRTDVDSLPKDPTGLWTADGERIIHQTVMRDGRRSHADIDEISEPGRWTKARDDGSGCPQENADCDIYMRPPDGLDVAQTDFEVAQRMWLNPRGSDHLVIRGLTFRYTNHAAIHVAGSDHILLDDNVFSHNANGHGNAYSVFITEDSDGAIVRDNDFFDSRYWGGYSNSKGLTFMVSGDEADHWVCNNEFWNFVGQGLTTKGGVSNVHAIHNYFHDLDTGVQVPDSRCHWKGCDGEEDGITYPGGGWTVRENRFESVDVGVQIQGTGDPDDNPVLPTNVHNNVFVDAEAGVQIQANTRDPLVRNNLYTGTGAGLWLHHSGGDPLWGDHFLDNGLDSDHNLYDADHAVYIRANWSGEEKGFSLDEYRSEYDGEANSLEEAPQVDEDYRPQPGSPLLDAGDPSVYPNASQVHIGPWPVGRPN